MPDRAFFALRNAAWACDDKEDKVNAVLCRKKALEYLDFIISNNPKDETSLVMKADFLRRAGEFDKVIELYSGKIYSEGILNKIIAFELKKAKEKDDRRYTVADVE